MNHFNHLSKSSFVRSDFVFLGLALLAAAGAMAQPVALEDGGEWAVEHVKASGTVRTIQDADSILSGASPFVSRNEARVPYLDFASDGGAGVFALNQPFPNAAAGGDDFVVRARGSIRMARGGVVTLGVGSDDGFRLRIDGVELASSANRAFAFTLVATNLAEGPHEVELVTWEATGAAGLEFVVARAHGDLASENEAVTTDRFRLMPASPPARIAAETEVVLRRGGLWDLRQRQRLEPPTAFGSMDEAEALLTASTGFEELTLSSGPAVLDHLSIGDPGYFGGDSAFPINGDSDRDSVVRGTARIFVERAGVHTFAVQASDTGRLRVDGRVVAANRAGAEPWNRVVGESKPVAWWRMDDADERAGVVTNRGSAAGHLGTLVGATLGIEGALGIGQAAAFNGTEFHRIESNVTEPITGPATLEYLLFGDDEGGAQALHDDGVQSIRMEQWSNTGLLGATRYGVGDYLFAPWSTGSTRSPFDRWVHLLFVRETLPAPRVKVYLDGALAGVLDVDLPFPVAVLGSKPASDGFTGWIDESVIYDRALGEDEIRAHQRIFDSARPGGVGLGSVELTEGWHEIEVTAWIRPGRGGLEVMVAGELGALTEFDPNRFQLLEASRPDAEGEPRVIAVTTTDPTGPGSLNAALVSLREAPADGAPAVIDLRAVRGRIGLTGPLPVIDRTTRILGPGEHLLTISSGGSNRVFWVAAGDVEFRDMTIADGWDRGEDSEGTGGGGLGAGAGLFVDSSAWVTVERVTFERNRVEGGVSRWVGGNSGGVGGSGFRTVMGDDGPVVEGIVGSNGSGGGSGADGSGLSGIHGRSGAAGSSGSAGRAGTEGSSFGGGGGGGGGGGSGGAGGAGVKGRNASPRVNFAGTFIEWNVAGNGGGGGRAGDGAPGGEGRPGGFGAGGGGGGNGGSGGRGGAGGAGGNGDSFYQFPIGTLRTPAGSAGGRGAGGVGADGGAGGGGGFGGGAGRGGIGGIGGLNGSSGAGSSARSANGAAGSDGTPGRFGGFANGRGGGAGAGLGGAIFVRSGGTLVIGTATFVDNEARGGRPTEDPELGRVGESGQGKGGAVFAMDGARVVVTRYPRLAGNLATDSLQVDSDNNDFHGVQLPAIDIAALNASRAALYYSVAPPEMRDAAILRFLDLLYRDVGTPRPFFEDMPVHYGAKEREGVRSQLASAWTKVREYPKSVEWRWHLLDLHYQRAMAEGILGDNLRGTGDAGRILPPPPGSQSFSIDQEIQTATEALAQYGRALGEWFELMETAEGYSIFRAEAPRREIPSATYIDEETGLPRRVAPEFPVPGATGYADLILAFDLLNDYAETAAELAELRFADEGAEKPELRGAVSTWLREVRSRGELLLSAFPELVPNDDLTPGLGLAIQTWRNAVSRLGTLLQAARGQANLLGFTDDFLLLLPRDSFDEDSPFDSFDRFKELLDPADPSGRLGFALAKLKEAESEYVNYQEQRGQYDAERAALVEQYRERLGEIGSIDQAGSEIAQQRLAIRLAQQQIRRNRVEMNNLTREVQIEVERNAKEKGINLAIQDIKLDYRGKIANLDFAIGIIEGTQKAADSYADAADSANPFGVGAKVANGVYQYAAEVGKAAIRFEQSRLAGEEEMKITSKENDRLDVNSAALIQTRLLEMRTLSVDSQSAALVLSQEVGRLVALEDERDSMLAKLDGVDRRLDSRYFADAGHRLRARRSTVLANQLFDDVQPWLHFMIRALEYKYTRPFSTEFAGRAWSGNSASLCRNARELELLWQALRNKDIDEGLRRSGLKDRYDWFSVREDFFGYRLGTNDAGEPLRYADPATGEPVDAITAFRSRVRRLMDSRGRVRLPFSTVREIPLPVGTFFLGPEFLANGTVDASRPGLCLDKIKWMKIRLPGPHTTTGNTLVGTLAYGGTGMMRNRTPGRFDPARPDEIEDEFTTYGTRVWRRNDEGDWYLDEQPETAIVVMAKEGGVRPDGRPAVEGQEPDILRSATRIDHFAERSVAASGWELVFDTEKPNPVNSNDKALRIDQLDDIEIYFYHYTANRN